MKNKYWVAELTDRLFNKTWADKLGAVIGIILLIILFVLPLLDFLGVINLPGYVDPYWDGSGYRGP